MDEDRKNQQARNIPDKTRMATPKLTGGSTNYYKVFVETPTSEGVPYTAECNDIIEALGLTFAEGEVFKAIWRKAAQRQGRGKPGNTALYDAEKIEFFGNRILVRARAEEDRR